MDSCVLDCQEEGVLAGAAVPVSTLSWLPASSYACPPCHSPPTCGSSLWAGTESAGAQCWLEVQGPLAGREVADWMESAHCGHSPLVGWSEVPMGGTGMSLPCVRAGTRSLGKNMKRNYFSEGPVVKTLLRVRGLGSLSCWGTKMPRIA